MKAILIPADPQQQMSFIDVSGWESMAKAIGGGCQYIERVNCVLTPEHRLVLVVDEDGLHRKTQHQNPRAQWLYPFSPIVGTVLVMAEGDTPDGIDFVDLPDAEHAMNLVRREVA